MELRKIFDRILSRDGDGEVVSRNDMSTVTLAKMRLASHPEAKPKTLMKLSRHGWNGVVARVAENSNTPIDVLAELATHGHPDVRIGLTENPNTPPRILVLLAADENADVRYSLAENHNAPFTVLALLCEDENPYVADRASKTLSRLRQSKSTPVWFPILQQRQQELG